MLSLSYFSMINNKPLTSADFNRVPADFPATSEIGAVTGAQPKLSLVEYEGKFYTPGTTPPERFQRWQICEDLARQFSEKSLESKAGKRSHMTEREILQQYYARLLKAGWVTDSEAAWIIHRAALIISWPQLEI